MEAEWGHFVSVAVAVVWDGSPVAGNLCLCGVCCGNVPRWVVCVTARSGVSNEDNLESAPEEPEDGLEGFFDNETVRSRGQNLVSTKVFSVV